MGSLVLLAVGLGFLAYGFTTLFWEKALLSRVTCASLRILDVGVIEVVRGSSFRWIEYMPVAQFRYTVQNQEYVGINVYMRGAASYEKRHEAEQQAAILKMVEQVYFDPRQPGLSFLISAISPSLRAHLHGVIGAGLLIVAVSMGLLMIK